MTDHLFVTVGAQMAFDRMIKVVDNWAAVTDRDVELFAQIGPTSFRPRHLPHVDFMGPEEFAERVDWADVIVSHAGMGTIISALVSGKPLVLLPRQGILRETRNDHQVATAERFSGRPGVVVALDETNLCEVLERNRWLRPETIGTQASDRLIRTIRDFIDA